jgi:hypothetical protein
LVLVSWIEEKEVHAVDGIPIVWGVEGG